MNVPRTAYRVLTPADVVTVTLLCVAPILRIALMTGAVGSDDVSYFHFSQRLLALQHFDELHHHGGRLFFLLLTGLPTAALGSVQAGAIVTIVYLSVRDVVVSLFVRHETGPTGAACAAGFLSVNALSTTYAGLFLPDALVSVLAFAAALLAYRMPLARNAARASALVIGAGIATAAAYSAKDSGILLTLPIVAWLALQRQHALTRRIAWIVQYAAAFAAIVGVEMAVYGWIAGDPLYRFHALSAVHNVGMGGGRSVYRFAQTAYWNLLSVLAPTAGTLPVLAIGALTFVLASALRSRLWFFAATGAFVGAYLVFGTSGLTRLVPMYVQDRYFEPVVPFVAVAIGSVAAAWVRRHGWRVPAAVAAFCAAVSFPAVGVNAGDVTFSAFGKNAALAISSIRHTDPDATVFVTPNLRFTIEPFVSREVFQSLKLMPKEGPFPRGYYVVHAFKDVGYRTPRIAEVEALPIALVVATDQHKLGVRWGKAVGNNDRAIVRVVR